MYALEMGSCAMIYIPSFTKIDEGIQKLIGGDTEAVWKFHTPTFDFFKIRKVG
jgi:hypothetical protein